MSSCGTQGYPKFTAGSELIGFQSQMHQEQGHQQDLVTA